MTARRPRKPAKPNRARIYGLARIDDERSHTHAWHVTITRQRRTFRRYFSDGVCGGKRAALKAANEASRGFRAVRGFRDMKHLVAALAQRVQPTSEVRLKVV